MPMPRRVTSAVPPLAEERRRRAAPLVRAVGRQAAAPLCGELGGGTDGGGGEIPSGDVRSRNDVS
jgi:hypothetical protein